MIVAGGHAARADRLDGDQGAGDVDGAEQAADQVDGADLGERTSTPPPWPGQETMAASAIVPTMKEISAAARLPVALPRVALIGACSGDQPARRRRSSGLRLPGPSRAIVGPDGVIFGRRRVLHPGLKPTRHRPVRMTNR